MKTFATIPRPEVLKARPCPRCASLDYKPLWVLEGFSFVACSCCGLVQQNPQPLEEAVLARYDRSYLDYEEARQFDYAALERLALADLRFGEVESTLLDVALSEGRRPAILDVGCATGALLATFRETGWDCLGVEACEPAARYGRERFGLDIRASTLEAARLPPASFDVIHASHLIEHLNDPAAFLRETHRLLRPDGRLVLTTPNIAGFQARVLGAAWRSAIHDHLYLFSKVQLEALVREAGFAAERWATWGGWAAGLRPAFFKKPLDSLAKRLGFGDVMAVMCGKVPT